MMPPLPARVGRARRGTNGPRQVIMEPSHPEVDSVLDIRGSWPIPPGEVIAPQNDSAERQEQWRPGEAGVGSTRTHELSYAGDGVELRVIK